MISILKTELFRLKKSVSFWVCFGLCAGTPLLTLLTNLSVASLEHSIDPTISVWQALHTETGVLSQTIEMIYYSSDWSILAIICTATVLSIEFSYGTIRNIILANKKRSDIFLAFWLTALIICGTYFITELVAKLLFLGTTSGFGTAETGVTITALLCHFTMGITSMLCVSTMICMIAFVTKKTSLAVVFPLLLCLVAPSIILLIEQLILMIISANTPTLEISEYVYECLPVYNLNTLSETNSSGLNVAMVIIYNLLFSALFFLIGMSSFKKADLK